MAKNQRTQNATAFGAELRRIREGLGLSQEAAEKTTGVSAEQLSRYETGARFPHAVTIAAIGDAYGIDDAELGKLVRSLNRPALEEVEATS